MSLSETLYIPIDPAQLIRIESVHKGFFYQHLYGVACLLSMQESNAEYIVIDRDEDLEIAFQTEYLYIQVKTRQDNLQFSDIADTIKFFGMIRAEHAEGKRSRLPSFCIISNVPPSPKLASTLKEASWPNDITLVWPGSGHESLKIPEPWADIKSGLEICIKEAEKIPFTNLASDTLILKLAAQVQWAATGHQNHTFNKIELNSLFEQIIIQLQDFPNPHSMYRPHKDEPSLISDQKIRLITGFSGSGKTSWASQLSQYTLERVTYFDVSDLPGAAIASSLARELTARFLSTSSERQASGILAASSGVESLKVLNKYIGSQDISIIVVLDNIHQVDTIALQKVIQAASNINFVLLAQPWPAQSVITSQFGIEAEHLSGWDEDTIASEFQTLGNTIDLGSAIRLKKATCGSPLFIQNASFLTKNTYNGKASDFIHALEAQTHLEITVQEVILCQIFEQLSTNARTLSAALSLSDIPLLLDEVENILTAMAGRQKIVGLFKELSSHGVLQVFQNKQVKLHDAFYVISKAHLESLGQNSISKAKIALRDLLFTSLLKGPDLGRSSLWVRLLPQTGQVDLLIDIATMEIFHEKGNPEELKAAIESASESSELSISDRFWALDALVFWNYHDGIFKDTPSQVAKMASLVKEGNLGNKEQFNLCMKKILLASKQGDAKTAKEEYLSGLKLSDNKSLSRILRYNYAMALFQLQTFKLASDMTNALTIEYYDHLGLDPMDVIAKNPLDILPLIKKNGWQDDLKHLADCLNLYAMCCSQLNLPSGLARMHAMKFYVMSDSYMSAVKAGQDAADEVLDRFSDVIAARQILESHVLPMVQHIPLGDLSISVRSHYAVILAYDGDIEAARNEISKLSVYETTNWQKREIHEQSLLIEDIASGRKKLPYREPPSQEDINRISRIISGQDAQRWMTESDKKKLLNDKNRKNKLKEQKIQRRKNRRK